MKKFLSYFFIILLFVPQIISWEHVIGHEHEIYDNKNANVHVQESECSSCFITRNSLDLSFSFSIIFIGLISIRKVKDLSHQSCLDNTPFIVNSLRGPPIV